MTKPGSVNQGKAQAQELSSRGVGKISSSQGETVAYLGKSTTLEGKLSFGGVLQLDGRFNGEIRGEGTLVIGESGNVKGRIDAGSVVVGGHLEGHISSRKRTEIRGKGEVYGDLFTTAIVIDEGGVLEGLCKMKRTPEPQS